MSEVLKSWQESASHWRRHHDVVAEMFAPITEAMCADAEIAPAQRVLDVAGGSGEPSLTLARRVAHVTHSDAVEGMVDTARALAAQEGLRNIEFVHAPAEALPFEDDAFDRAFCRLGLMFFGDAQKGLGEMLRVTRPDGRICVATWGAQDHNPFFEIPLQVLGRYVDLADSVSARALKYDSAAVLERALRDAGGVDVRAREAAFVMRTAIEFEAWWALRVEVSSTFRTMLPKLSPAHMDEVIEEVRTRTRGWFTPAGVEIPATVIVATASPA